MCYEYRSKGVGCPAWLLFVALIAVFVGARLAIRSVQDDARSALVRRGEALLHAIHEYKNQTGLWPMSLVDLNSSVTNEILEALGEDGQICEHPHTGGSPRLSKRNGSDGHHALQCMSYIPMQWKYTWCEGRGFDLDRYAHTEGRGYDYLGYNLFHVDSTSVNVFSNADFLSFEKVQAVTPSDDGRFRLKLKEISRREEVYRFEPIHSIAKIDLLLRGGKFDEAKASCLDYARRHADRNEWWLKSVLARIDYEQASSEDNEPVLFAMLDRASEDARISNRVSIESQRRLGLTLWERDSWFFGDLPYISEPSAFETIGLISAMRDYRKGEYTRATKLLDDLESSMAMNESDLWTASHPSRVSLFLTSVRAPAFYALYACCELARGNLEDAKRGLARAQAASQNCSWRWHSFLNEVSLAIESGNMSFRAPRGVFPLGFNLSVVYE